MSTFNLALVVAILANTAQAQQQYIVQPGDSLSQIATREMGNADAWREVCEFNNLADCNRIFIGQVLQLSTVKQDGSETSEVSEARSEPAEFLHAPQAPQVKDFTKKEQTSGLNGVATGVIGQGGSLPLGWSIGGFQGAEVAQAGIEEGLPFVDLRFSGAAASSAIFVNLITVEDSTEISKGQFWTSAAFIKLVDGSLKNVDNVFLRIQEFAGSDGKGSSGTNVMTDLDTRSHAIVTREISDANTNKLKSFIRIEASDGEIDLTLRITQPQIERVSR
jgi:LysM repeat protein